MPVSIYSRYHGMDQVEIDGKVSLAFRRAALPESYPDSLTHTLVGGQILDQLAAHYYGREDLWWRISDANPTVFPLDWQPTDTLDVPPIRVATQTPRR